MFHVWQITAEQRMPLLRGWVGHILTAWPKPAAKCDGTVGYRAILVTVLMLCCTGTDPGDHNFRPRAVGVAHVRKDF